MCVDTIMLLIVPQKNLQAHGNSEELVDLHPKIFVHIFQEHLEKILETMLFHIKKQKQPPHESVGWWTPGVFASPPFEAMSTALKNLGSLTKEEVRNVCALG